jgi:hypothetical protein
MLAVELLSKICLLHTGISFSYVGHNRQYDVMGALLQPALLFKAFHLRDVVNRDGILEALYRN